MNESLKKYLLSLNCHIINPIKASLTDDTIVGFYCDSTSILRKPEHLKLIERFIEKNKLDYYISDSADNRTEFSIYIK